MHSFRRYVFTLEIEFNIAFMTIGSSIDRLSQTESTNNYAAAQLMTKRPNEGAVFVADCQTVGRGQINNFWESEPGKNLTFSFVIYPEFLRIDRQFEISKAVSLGVADFLSERVDRVRIKWPNDLYVENRKIAGILIENSIRMGKISSCIVGIGLNINQQKFLSDAPNPVSLAMLTGGEYDLVDLLEKLLLKIDARYQQLKSGLTHPIDSDYLSCLYRYQEWAHYRMNDEVFEGKIKGVDEIGRLMIENRQQNTLTFHFKEVAFCK